MEKRGASIELDILPQPDNTTCGPTCLHAVYRYWDDPLPLERVIAEVAALPGGGTLAVSLACHALRRGFMARIYTCNLVIFDPTWFTEGANLVERLQAQKRASRSRKLALATGAYLEFLELGGELAFEDLTAELMLRYIAKGAPVIAGLSATYLYGCARELDDEYDDIRGRPVGHFVVLSGWNPEKREIMIADPLRDNPRFGSQYYRVGADRLFTSVLLGVITYDANLLIITPKGEKAGKE